MSCKKLQEHNNITRKLNGQLLFKEGKKIRGTSHIPQSKKFASCEFAVRQLTCRQWVIIKQGTGEKNPYSCFCFVCSFVWLFFVCFVFERSYPKHLLCLPCQFQQHNWKVLNSGSVILSVSRLATKNLTQPAFWATYQPLRFSWTEVKFKLPKV